MQRRETRNPLTPLPFQRGRRERLFEWQGFCHLGKVPRTPKNGV
jgi:hypothetical protein